MMSSYIPIFLGGIMQACGNTPPINVKSQSANRQPPPTHNPTNTTPDKNEYITADRIRRFYAYFDPHALGLELREGHGPRSEAPATAPA